MGRQKAGEGLRQARVENFDLPRGGAEAAALLVGEGEFDGEAGVQPRQIDPLAKRGGKREEMVDQRVGALAEEGLVEPHGPGEQGEGVPVRFALPHRRAIAGRARCMQ